MRYCVPVNAACEVGALAAAGADELYCGYQDRWWEERYGDHDSASRRQGRANLATRAELASTAAAAREAGVPIWLALNARYTEPQLGHLVGLCDDFAASGGTGVIVSDLGLLWQLRGHAGLAVTLSLLAAAQNVATLRTFGRLGVGRVVFPRFVGPDEAGALLSAVPGMQGEVMAFFDKCPLVDGYCRHRHGVAYPDREASADDPAPPLYTFDTTYRSHACLAGSRFYLQPYPCAACHVGAFEEAGVGFAKLGGRGRSLEERLRALRFLRRAEELENDEARRRLYHETFATACSCYYGSACQSRRAVEPLPLPTNTGRCNLGSQTSYEAFRVALGHILRGEADMCGMPVTLVMPPMSEPQLTMLRAVFPKLARCCPPGTHLCTNDLGTLVEVARLCQEAAAGLVPTMGTLLARTDNPREVAQALSADANPARPVWGPNGEPRMLTYRRPPEPLVRHWQHPSGGEASAQEALRMLTGAGEVRCEFPVDL